MATALVYAFLAAAVVSWYDLMYEKYLLCIGIGIFLCNYDNATRQCAVVSTKSILVEVRSQAWEGGKGYVLLSLLNFSH